MKLDDCLLYAIVPCSVSCLFKDNPKFVPVDDSDWINLSGGDELNKYLEDNACWVDGEPLVYVGYFEYDNSFKMMSALVNEEKVKVHVFVNMYWTFTGKGNK